MWSGVCEKCRVRRRENGGLLALWQALQIIADFAIILRMTDLPTNAHIVELGEPDDELHLSTVYDVKLDFVPRVGDLIDLYSFVDTASNHQSRHFYEVVKVLHKIHDVTGKFEPSLKGHHFVKVFVKVSTDISDNEFF